MTYRNRTPKYASRVVRILSASQLSSLKNFKYINQPDATISQVYYLTFTRMYSSTCFGHPHAHHQELNSCNNSLWFYRFSVVVAVLLVVVGPVGPATTAVAASGFTVVAWW